MRNTILGLAVILLAFTVESAEAQTRLKLATLAPQNSGWAREFTAGAKEVETRTEGRVKLQFFWGGAQGAESKVMQKIKIGQLHGGTFSPTDFQQQFPVQLPGSGHLNLATFGGKLNGIGEEVVDDLPQLFRVKVHHQFHFFGYKCQFDVFAFCQGFKGSYAQTSFGPSV